jgi:hypothetical protein
MQSEEMKPQWWSWDDIPFQSMWADDILWFPFLLQALTPDPQIIAYLITAFTGLMHVLWQGQLFQGDVVFKNKTDIGSHDIQPTQELAMDIA